MSERAKRAIAALREPDASLARVVNTVRQSIAEVIEHQQILIDVQADRIEALEVALREFVSCFSKANHGWDTPKLYRLRENVKAALALEHMNPVDDAEFGMKP